MSIHAYMQQPCISTNHAWWCNHHKANMRWDPERLGSNQHLGAGGATVLCALLLHVPIASSLCVFAHCVTTGTSCFENTVTNFLSSVTLDKWLSKLYIDNGFFVECIISDTWQRKVTVTTTSGGDGGFAEFTHWHLANQDHLPSVCWPRARQRKLQWAPCQPLCREPLAGTWQREHQWPFC